MSNVQKIAWKIVEFGPCAEIFVTKEQQFSKITVLLLKISTFLLFRIPLKGYRLPPAGSNVNIAPSHTTRVFSAPPHSRESTFSFSYEGKLVSVPCRRHYHHHYYYQLVNINFKYKTYFIIYVIFLSQNSSIFYVKLSISNFILWSKVYRLYYFFFMTILKRVVKLDRLKDLSVLCQVTSSKPGLLS